MNKIFKVILNPVIGALIIALSVTLYCGLGILINYIVYSDLCPLINSTSSNYTLSNLYMSGFLTSTIIAIISYFLFVFYHVGQLLLDKIAERKT